MLMAQSSTGTLRRSNTPDNGELHVLHTSRKLSVLFAAGLLVVGLAACGDDDDDDTAVGAEDDTTETTEHDMGDEEGAPDVNPCAEGVDPADAGLPEPEEPAEGATPITVQAEDYEFTGADALAAGGSFAVTFENDGEELHEMLVQRIDESETRSIEEMMQSEEKPETVTDVAFGFACPGTSTTFNAELAEPGRYVVLCFIPTGTTPETDPADFESGGAPHALNGMYVELEVEA
jgi:hypothetical protein